MAFFFIFSIFFISISGRGLFLGPRVRERFFVSAGKKDNLGYFWCTDATKNEVMKYFIDVLPP